MTSTIVSLFRFQEKYLLKLLANVSEEDLYKKQFEGFNSAGWILGHFCVEAEDVLKYYEIPYHEHADWVSLFRNTTGKIKSLDNLPSKEELLNSFKERYDLLCEKFDSLSSEELKQPHPSTFMKDFLPDIESWIAHHLTTHISLHIGNLVVWKKMIGLEVGGY